MSEPVTVTYTRDEMITRAREYMREAFGECREATDRDKWCERLGMLADFIYRNFPEPEPRHDNP